MAEKHANFTEYFRKIYCGRVDQWATCHRIGTPANTNMHIESFHRSLKVVYLDGKHNRRVDSLVHGLFRLARHLMHNQLSKVEIGKASHRLCEIHKRHRSALEMVEANTCTSTQVEQNVWHFSYGHQQYITFSVLKN